MGEFIDVLEQQGYTLADLLDSLAEWVDKQPKYSSSELVWHLEKAGSQAFQYK